MKFANIIKEVTQQLSSTKSTEKTQYKVDLTSILNMLLLLKTKYQQLIKRCLTNTIVYLSIIHFMLFYLISIVMAFVMMDEESQKKMHCKCYFKRHFFLREKEFQYRFEDLLKQLYRIKKADPRKIRPLRINDTEDPASAPKFWITKIYKKFWEKNDLVVQLLSDSAIGIRFKDKTTMLFSLQNVATLRYIDDCLDETILTFESYPEKLKFKVAIMDIFTRSKRDAYSSNSFPKTENELTELPYILKHFNYLSDTFICLSNYTFQIYLSDNSNIILCPKNGTITFINDKKEGKTYKLDLIERYGCSEQLFVQLKFSYKCINFLIKKSKECLKLNGVV